MTEAKQLSTMDISQLHAAIVALDLDLWSHASEQEMAATYQRCTAYQSPLLRTVRSAWFLFAFSFLVVCLWLLGHPGRFLFPKGAGGALLFAVTIGFLATPLAGILRLLLDGLSGVSGIDRAASVARQLKPLGLHSAAYTRVDNLVATCHECAAYQRQLAMRGRTLRLIDFGAMVYLSNKALVVRRT